MEPLTITAAAPLVCAGTLSPVDLLDQCLARVDRYEARVRAWVHLDRDRARKEARDLTDELARGHYRGPLHGIPIGIKDIIDVYDMPTGCGSKLWANSYARRDATVVERLHRAGAIIMGKTVTTPYAFMDPPVTRNPWNLDRTPGGSSSGSAAAVACGMCLAALGTQTGGSITRPASYCGVYSLKPTYGRVSVNGVLPLAPSLDHVGVMANCVRDLAVVFQAMAGHDHLDSRSKRAAIPECVGAIDKMIGRLERGELEERSRPRFGFLGDFFEEQAAPEIQKFASRCERDLRTLAHARTSVKKHALFPGFADVTRNHRIKMAVEAARVHGERFRRHPEDYPPKITALVEEGLILSAAEYYEADCFEVSLYENFHTGAGIEIQLSPATTDLAPDPTTTGSPLFNSPWSYLGFPTVSVPLGWSQDGMPMALQFISGALDEEHLLESAAWVDHVFRLDGAYQPRALPL
ncbi:amidase [Fimbriiglobus ruber]|uniref:Aspartyl-tRNA(Asn) amidotransferase subunit A n=1 Tax=Fimbriiglobus ruber TaxID=1908690 RepID=A0A225DZH5_9BACT|nr:amidase [Fimbriiglobus ruber]OWK46702.1 Aspartyl-tRNA(Asn) amidotransferase subunit A [Fimbriiglobus ruber]